MAGWVGQIVAQALATAIAGVAVGWVLLGINRRMQRKDAAQVIQQRLETLWVEIYVSVRKQKEWFKNGDPKKYSIGFYDWVPTANILAALLQEQQFAIFDQETRARFFFFRDKINTQIYRAEKGIKFDRALNTIEESKYPIGSDEFAAWIDLMSRSLAKYSQEIRNLSGYLQSEFKVASYAAKKEGYDEILKT